MTSNEDLMKFLAKKIKEFKTINQMDKNEILTHLDLDEGMYYKIISGRSKTIRSDILLHLLERLDTFILIGSDDYGNIDLKNILKNIDGMIEPVRGSLDD